MPFTTTHSVWRLYAAVKTPNNGKKNKGIVSQDFERRANLFKLHGVYLTQTCRNENEKLNRGFSYDVMAAILKRRPCWCTKPNPVGVQLFSYVNAFFCFNKFAFVLAK